MCQILRSSRDQKNNIKKKLQSHNFNDDKTPLSGDDKNRDMTLSKLLTNQKKNWYFSVCKKNEMKHFEHFYLGKRLINDKNYSFNLI